MSTHNSIDDMFQQHFADLAIPMNNQEELWARISEKKDKRRGGGYLWFGVLGLALLSLAGWQYMDFSSAGQKIAISATTTMDNPEPQRNEVQSIGFVTKETTDIEKSHSTTDITSAVKSIAEKPPYINRTVDKSVMPTSKVISVLTTTSRETKNEVPRSTTEPTVNSISSEQIGLGNTMNLEEDREEQLSRRVDDLTVIKTAILAPYLHTSIPPVYNEKDSWSRCEIKTPGHFFVDVYGQAGLPKDKVDFSQAGTDQTAYRDLWNTRFSPKASWHAGAQIGYELPNGLRLSAGAEYQELVTEYSDNQRVVETIRVYDPQAFFTIDMNGDRVWVGDTVTAINIYERRFVRKNVHTLIHIPVQASYDIYKKPSFHVALDVAAALNISKTYEGQYIRSDQTLIMIGDENQDNYISEDIGVSLSAGLHFGYYLNDNVEVYGSPRFTYNPNSYLLDTETLKISRNIVALRAGVRYHF